MNQKKLRLVLALVFVLVFVGMLGTALWLREFAPTGETATITVDDTVVARIDLSQVKEPYTMQVGKGNTVLVEHGAISMHSADCPDQLCVKQGKIRNAAYPIVCLPNRVVIRVEKKSEIDVVLGG